MGKNNWHKAVEAKKKKYNTKQHIIDIMEADRSNGLYNE